MRQPYALDEVCCIPLTTRMRARTPFSYLPGAIVRVQLKSFLTYDFAEFFPGPYLNMIIVRVNRDCAGSSPLRR